MSDVRSPIAHRLELQRRAAARQMEAAYREREASRLAGTSTDREEINEMRRRADRAEALARLLAHPDTGSRPAELALMERLGLSGSTPDPTELTAGAARLRRQAKAQERTMSLDTSNLSTIHAGYVRAAAEIRDALLELAKSDAYPPRIAEQTRDLRSRFERIRAAALAEYGKARGTAGADIARRLNADSRTNEQVGQDTLRELRAERLRRTVDGETAARNILLGKAQALAATGNVSDALAHAMAAEMHGVGEAPKMRAALERRLQAEWPGHAEAEKDQAAVDEKDRAWQVEIDRQAFEISQAAVAAALRSGDLELAASLQDERLLASLKAKNAAMAEAAQTGTAYQSPVTWSGRQSSSTPPVRPRLSGPEPVGGES